MVNYDFWFHWILILFNIYWLKSYQPIGSYKEKSTLASTFWCAHKQNGQKGNSKEANCEETWTKGS